MPPASQQGTSPAKSAAGDERPAGVGVFEIVLHKGPRAQVHVGMRKPRWPAESKGARSSKEATPILLRAWQNRLRAMPPPPTSSAEMTKPGRVQHTTQSFVFFIFMRRATSASLT